jgi:putative Holliday junction resolvase
MAQPLKSNGYVLGVDYGDSKIGLALAGAVARLPEALKSIPAQDAAVSLKKIVEEKDIQLIVVGLPRSLEGNETKQTQKAREFGEKLKSQVRADVAFADETLSSVRAQDYLKDNKRSDKDIDSIAACFILEEFFEQTKGGENSDG